MFSFFFLVLRSLRILWYGFQDHEFRSLLLLVIFLLLSGTFFYHGIEGWKPLDALYFSVTTLTTVGLGDLTPRTDLGKLFTIVYIFVGLGVILGFIDIVAHHSRKQNPLSGFLKRKVKRSKR